MRCPYCQTENREDRERCYVCDKDISMLRLIVNKARHHYNLGLEHAERGRLDEAISELHNALDLDRQFLNAHVVLGTLYAKKKDFARAQEAWKAAIALNPELAKAHQYLQRVETVQHALPAMRVAKVFSAVLLAVTLSLGAALLYAKRPDPAAAKLLVAQQAYVRQDYGKAIGMLEQAQRSKGSNASVVSAKALQSALEMEMRRQLMMIQSLKSREQYAMALAQIGQLEKRMPDLVTSSQLALLKDDVLESYLNQTKLAYSDYREGALSYAQLTAQVKDFLRLYPENVPEKEKLRAKLAQAREEEAQRNLRQIRTAFQQKRDIASVLEQLQRLASQFPGAEAVQQGRSQTVNELAVWLFDEFQERLDRKDFDAAQDQLASIQELVPQLSRWADLSQPLRLAYDVLEEERKAARMRKAGELISAGKTLEAQKALAQLASADTLTSCEQQLVRSFEAQLQKQELLNEFQNLRQREKQFLALEISDQEASRVLSRFETALEEMAGEPADEQARLLACAVASAIRLGERQRAEQLLTRLRRSKGAKEYADSLSKHLTQKKRR